MLRVQRGVSRPALLFAAALAGSALSGPACAQTENYPTRPVRVILPFPPGGSLDFNARAIQDKFSRNIKAE